MQVTRSGDRHTVRAQRVVKAMAEMGRVTRRSDTIDARKVWNRVTWSESGDDYNMLEGQ